MTSKNHSPQQNPEIPKLSEGQLEPLFRRLNLATIRTNPSLKLGTGLVGRSKSCQNFRN